MNMDIETRVTNLENSVSQILAIVNDLLQKIDNPTKEETKPNLQPQQKNMNKQKDLEQFQQAKTLFIEVMKDGEYRTLDEIRELTELSGKIIKRIINNLRKKNLIKIDIHTDPKKYRFEDIPF